MVFPLPLQGSRALHVLQSRRVDDASCLCPEHTLSVLPAGHFAFIALKPIFLHPVQQLSSLIPSPLLHSLPSASSLCPILTPWSRFTSAVTGPSNQTLALLPVTFLWLQHCGFWGQRGEVFHSFSAFIILCQPATPAAAQKLGQPCGTPSLAHTQQTPPNHQCPGND